MKTGLGRATLAVLSVVAQVLFYGYVFSFTLMHVGQFRIASGHTTPSMDSGVIVIVGVVAIFLITVVARAVGYLKTVRSILLMTTLVAFVAALSGALLL